jgi:hypothetical protein
VAAGVALAVVLNFVMMTELAARLIGMPKRPLLTVHLRHMFASIPIVAAAALAAVSARSAGLPDAAVLLATLVAAAAAGLLLFWQFRWIFGEDAHWAHQLAMARLSKRKSKPKP